MQDKVKNIVVTVLFSLIFIGFFLANVLMEDVDISVAERRRLTQFPELTLRTVLSSRFMDQFETYAAEQFPLRDQFRRVKTFMAFDVFRHLDNNDLFFIDDKIFSIIYPLNENEVMRATNNTNNIINRYFQNNPNVFLSIIPNKNYFLPETSRHLRLDYERLVQIMTSEVNQAKYIDIFGTLNLDSFYRTDLHWRQEKLTDTVNTISRYMNMGLIHDNAHFEKTIVPNFRGSYFGQLGINIPPDELIFLNNWVLEDARVTFNNNQRGPVHNPRGKDSIDMYDIFLSGAKALIQIDNPHAESERELVIFRDSFGSSIAPLLIPAYGRITIIDLRYISSNFVSQMVQFNDNQDILFLYSVNILNSGSILR